MIFFEAKIYYIILLVQARDFITVQISIHCTDLPHFVSNRKNTRRYENCRTFAESLSTASRLRNLRVIALYKANSNFRSGMRMRLNQSQINYISEEYYTFRKFHHI